MIENNKYNLDKIIKKTDSINSLDLYLKNSPELRSSLKQFVIKYSNDMKLGSEIRKLYYEVSDNKN